MKRAHDTYEKEGAIRLEKIQVKEEEEEDDNDDDDNEEEEEGLIPKLVEKSN